MKPAHPTTRTTASRACLIAALLISLCAFNASQLAAASVKVRGFGLFGNVELKGALKLLEIEDGPIDASKIDDGAFLLLTRLTQNGFLDASVTAEFESASGEKGTATWTSPFEPQIEEEVSVEKLQYTTIPGTLYHYNTVSIDGLQSIEVEDARSYIIPDSALISRKKDRSYSDSILSNHQNQLAAALAALGRIDAKVTASSVEIDKASGAVDVRLLVEEGPLYKVTKAEVSHIMGESVDVTEMELGDTIYTRTWVEDQTSALRNEYYHLGYPDTKVSSKIIKATPEGDTVSVHIGFEVKPGPPIILSKIEHRGATDTYHTMLDRKTHLQTGVPLDITEAEAARRRLSRIGIFERIDLTYEPDGEGQRKAVFNYKNGKRVEAQLLFGYGSYEQFRAGLLARKENIFGRAHTLTFSAIRSIKSSSGGLNYTVPELLGESISGNVEVNYLDREELYFDRKEQGVSLGLFTSLPKLKLDIGLDYAFDRKESSDPQFDKELRLEDTNIGSLAFRVSRSTLDNVLYPTSGYILSGAVRYAAKSLGGQTEFLKPEYSFAYHKKLGSRLLFHFGAKGAQITSSEIGQKEIPDNEFYLVGGENSVRGYRRGEAAPLAENGKPTRVEAFGLFNLELEYPILDQLNVVLFADAARVWESTEFRDVYEDLASVGLGFRYNTIVGPVRLEYGHNIDPRPEDPRGTVHLSIGFPF